MKYFSMFSGIGGFEFGINAVLPNAECIGFSEINKYAISIYQYHYPGHKNYGSATDIVPESLPDFDLIVGGFPCQAFSIAGKRGGFEDTRGTLFFEIARIARVKRPKHLLLENVKGLLNHDQGNTFEVIITAMDELGYDAEWEVLNSKNFGVPQNRERVFIVGHRREQNTDRFNVFPLENYGDKYERIIGREKVYLLSEYISKNVGLLLIRLSEEQKQELSKEQMQNMLEEIRQGIQKDVCCEIPGDTEAVDSNPEGSFQVVKELNSWTQSIDNSRDVCGVVSIPTKDMLLLWNNGGRNEVDTGSVQQQSISSDGGQVGLIEGIRRGEFGSLLLAVQPYKGRLFYSIGNGRDWHKIYTAQVEEKCKTNLSCVLEDRVDEKYFLSETMTKKLTMSTK
jgi:DNA-cytosine methyltransferase